MSDYYQFRDETGAPVDYYQLVDDNNELCKEIKRLNITIKDQKEAIEEYNNKLNEIVKERNKYLHTINEIEKELNWLLERQYESERFAKEHGFDTYLPAKENLLCVKNKLQELKRGDKE